MRSILTLVSLLACLVTTTYATALTYRLEAHEKACFFAQVEHKGTKLAFYFAVRAHTIEPQISQEVTADAIPNRSNLEARSMSITRLSVPRIRLY